MSLVVGGLITGSDLPVESLPTLAVMPLKAKRVEAEIVDVVESVLVDYATSLGSHEVIAWNDIVAMLDIERRKSALGCESDESCLAEIGGALGVDFLLPGQIGRLGSQVVISFTLIDAQEQRAVRRVNRRIDNNEDLFATTVEELIDELLQIKKVATQELSSQVAPSSMPSAANPLTLETHHANLEPVNTWGWLWTGTSGALAIAGGVTLAMTPSEDAIAQGQYPTYDDLKAKARARNIQVVSGWALVGGSVAALGLGMYELFWSESFSPLQTQISLSSTELALHVGFQY
jgi:TolB-like protein